MTKKTTAKKTTDAPIPYRPAPARKAKLDDVRTLADIGITAAQVLAYVGLVNALNGGDDDYYPEVMALGGRVIHDSYGLRVVLIVADEEHDGEVFTITPGVRIVKDRVCDEVRGIGYIHDGVFVDPIQMGREDHESRLANVVPHLSADHARTIRDRRQNTPEYKRLKAILDEAAVQP